MNPFAGSDDTNKLFSGAFTQVYSIRDRLGSGHNKWICGSEHGMYVWERLHVQGRRISVCARRRQKITDSYPFFF